MAKRGKLSKKTSRKIFMANTVPKRKNLNQAVPMRGGFRL